MNIQVMVWRQLQAVLEEMRQLVRLLAIVEDPPLRNLAVQQLLSNIGQVQFLTNLQMQPAPLPPPLVSPGALPGPAMAPGPVAGMVPAPFVPAGPHMPVATTPPLAPTAPAEQLPVITRAQLATFTGRNGQPAYVAVNGTVYDVTNNAAWSAASHFGLPAGRDLTADFASCHAGQQWILATLRPVGRLAS